MAFACGFWNGINSLIIPVAKSGRPIFDPVPFLEARAIEQLFVHERLSDSVSAALARDFNVVSPLHKGFDRRELHPIHLLPGEPRPENTIAQLDLPEGARMRRLKLACWGHIPSEDRSHWTRTFAMAGVTIHGSANTGLLAAQIRSRTPLQATERYMGAFAQDTPTWERYLWIFAGATFNDLVNFWNCRARTTGWDGRPHMVGMPREALGSAETMELIPEWCRPSGDSWVKPDVIVCAPTGSEAKTRAAFGQLGFVEYVGDSITHGFGAERKERHAPEFQLAGPMISGAMRRGMSGSTLATYTGDGVSLDLPLPEGFDVSASRVVRIELHNLPLELPVNDRLAQAILPAARASIDGVGFGVLSGRRPWTFDLQIPSGWEALRLWGEGCGFDVQRSQAGRYGEALLGRLERAEALDALATEPAQALLAQLAPLSAKKFAQHLVSDAGGDLQEDKLINTLRREALWMELRSRTLAEITSNTRIAKKEMLGALSATADFGFVRRGRALRCPACNYPSWIPLSGLDERVQCSACGNDHPLPVSDRGGTREAETHYRLDGLMARCIDQDLLVVLLALRATELEQDAVIEQSWPGLLLLSDGDHATEVEIDLLVSTGRRVTVLECKTTAENLQPEEADRLVSTAARMKALPSVAALHGEFSPQTREKVVRAGGLCLERHHLLRERRDIRSP